MTTMQYPMQSGYLQPQQESKHYIMGYIAARWPNFGAGKKSEQKRQMIAVWEQDLADIPLALQKAALDAKARAGQLFPPSSPVELRRWCEEVQPSMTALDVAVYQTALECNLLDADFCRRQIAKYNAGAHMQDGRDDIAENNDSDPYRGCNTFCCA